MQKHSNLQLPPGLPLAAAQQPQNPCKKQQEQRSGVVAHGR